MKGNLIVENLSKTWLLKFGAAHCIAWPWIPKVSFEATGGVQTSIVSEINIKCRLETVQRVSLSYQGL
jgi:hypothetical protein